MRTCLKLVAAALLGVAIVVLLVREVPGQTAPRGATGVLAPLCGPGSNALARADAFSTATGYASADAGARTATGVAAGIKFDLARSSPCSIR